MVGYAAVAWLAVVYMAEKRIIDVAAGVVLTVPAYALVEGVAAAWAAHAAPSAAARPRAEPWV